MTDSSLTLEQRLARIQAEIQSCQEGPAFQSFIAVWQSFLPAGWAPSITQGSAVQLQVTINGELHAAPSRGRMVVLLMGLAMALFDGDPALRIALRPDEGDIDAGMLALALPGWSKFSGQVIVPTVSKPAGKGRHGFEVVTFPLNGEAPAQEDDEHV